MSSPGLSDTTVPPDCSSGTRGNPSPNKNATPSKKPSRDITKNCKSSIQVRKTRKANTNFDVVFSAEFSSSSASLPLTGGPFLYLLRILNRQRFREGYIILSACHSDGFLKQLNLPEDTFTISIGGYGMNQPFDDPASLEEWLKGNLQGDDDFVHYNFILDGIGTLVFDLLTWKGKKGQKF
jgi:hypothetical protein